MEISCLATFERANLPHQPWLFRILGSYKTHSLAKMDIHGIDPPEEVIRWFHRGMVLHTLKYLKKGVSTSSCSCWNNSEPTPSNASKLHSVVSIGPVN